MEDYLFISVALKLGYAFLAAFGLVSFTRWLDRRAGVTFTDIATKIRTEATAAAIYYGCRILALGLVVGLVVGCAPVMAAEADGGASPWTGLLWFLAIIAVAMGGLTLRRMREGGQ